MNTYILIAVAIILMGMIAGMMSRRKPKFIEDQAREKAMNLEKIREMLKRQEKISNNDIENSLGVSDATVTRYMEELEKLREVEQVGKEGRYVYYQRIK